MSLSPSDLPPSSAPYQRALNFLYGRINYEQAAVIPYESRELNLERMGRLLAGLGNPHDALPCIHIAGTKGKGSTAAMVAAILQAAGYRVGLYSSPHLVELEERFSVNGRNCTRAELVELTEQTRAVVEQLDGEAVAAQDRCTFFELTTAMAWLYFQRCKVDVVVLEVGLGGRLDSTNVCRPLVTAITSISFDHTKQLGNTLAAIAGEKAGIIKAGVPIVSGVVDEEPAAVIRRIARERSAPLCERDRDFRITYRSATDGFAGVAEFHLAGSIESWWLEDLRLGMLGAHQARNAGVALATIAYLKRQGWRVSDEACRAGLETARCPARVEVVASRPTVILDAAHNDASIAALVQTLDEYFPTGPRTLIFAAARDKDVEGMLRVLLPHFQRVVLTQFVANPRGMPVGQLAELARTTAWDAGLLAPGRPLSLESHATPADAWRVVAPSLTADSLVCIAGSFFLAAEVRPLVT